MIPIAKRLFFYFVFNLVSARASKYSILVEKNFAWGKKILLVSFLPKNFGLHFLLTKISFGILNMHAEKVTKKLMQPILWL